MRTFLSGVVALTLAFTAGAAAKQPAAMVIEGKIVAGSGPDARPVRRARVTLTGGGLTAPRISDSDAKGAYRFPGLAPGSYKIAVQKPGYVRLDADAAPGATLTMIRGGAIEGVVADAAGNPVAGVVVRALQPDAAGAQPKAIAQARTDDLGRYRLHSLPAGDFLVEAATDQLFVQSQLTMPGEKRAEIARGYFPAADTIEAAKPVRVTAGRDVSAIDVRLTPPWPAPDAAAPPSPPRPDETGTARIAGRVTDAATGKPIRGARLLLVALDGVALTNWKRTDAQGRFEYTKAQARRYQLTASADRFVSLQYGQKRPGETGTPIQVRDGEDFTADIALPRGGAIEGLVFDEFGDGAPGLVVRAARKVYAAGRHRLMPLERREQTPISDDRGRYRIAGLDPGEYYVAALSGAYAEQSEVGGFAPTYYPGTTDAAGASTIAVTIGADASATFALAPARTFTVAGTVVDADGRPVGRGTLWLMTPDRLQRMDFNLARGGSGADGRFALRNVPQGEYTLQGFGVPPPGGRGPGNLGAMPFGSTPVTVGDSDVDGVVLKVTTGTTLRGKIVLDDSAAAPPKPGEVSVTAIPVEFDTAPVGGGPPPSTTNADWTFEVTNMSGLRRVFVNVSSTTWALKKITLNDRDITDLPVDFRSKDVEGVEVLLTPKVATITGGVTDDKAQPVTDYAVVIFASDPGKWIDRSRFVMMARPNQQGRFFLRGVPPEDYLAVALPGVVLTEWMDPLLLQQLRPLATSFTLSEGESKTLDLKLKKRP